MTYEPKRTLVFYGITRLVRRFKKNKDVVQTGPVPVQLEVAE